MRVLGEVPHGRTFADMPTNLRGDHLGAWIATAQQAALPGVAGCATGLTSDLDAVTAGLTLSHSSGPVEGNVKTGSRCSSGRCMAAGASTFSANACYSLGDAPPGAASPGPAGIDGRRNQ